MVVTLSVRVGVYFSAVAVSGGCDSLALTLLAKKIFNRVIGITVDHRWVAHMMRSYL